MANKMPLPGIARMVDAGPPPAAEGGENEGGETCHLSAEQLNELNTSGTTQSDDGETITADIGGADSAAAAPPMAPPSGGM